MTFQECINDYLTQLDYTVRELSAASGISTSVISRYRRDTQSPEPDAIGNDISDWFEYLDFLFSSVDMVLMQVKRDESTLAGGPDNNILTGDYVLLPRMVYPK